jgi:hypothetical protein
VSQINCWEYKQCSREPEDIYAFEFEICPASVEVSLNETHGDKNGGR